MLTLRIKTVWQGQAAMRDKYWSDLKRTLQSLRFVYTGMEPQYYGQTMTIPFTEISERILRRAKMKVPDKFSGAYHVLLYFKWIPDGVANIPEIENLEKKEKLQTDIQKSLF